MEAPLRESLWSDFPVEVPTEPEVERVYRLAGWIGLHSSDDHLFSFTSVFLALLMAEDGLSVWFQKTLAANGLSFERIAQERELGPGARRQLRERAYRNENAVGKPSWTSSARSVFDTAVEFRSRVTPASPLGIRHVLAAYVRPSAGHENDLRQRGIDPRKVAEAFVREAPIPEEERPRWAREIGVELPAEANFHGEKGAEESQSDAVPTALHAPEFTDVAWKVMCAAAAFAMERRSSPARLSSTCLMFALVETGRTSGAQGSAHLFYDSVAASADLGGRYASEIAEYLGDTPTAPDRPTETIEVLFTRRAAEIFLSAKRLRELAPGSAKVRTRHLVEALLGTDSKSGAHIRLRQIGVDLDALHAAFRAFLAAKQPSGVNGQPTATSEEPIRYATRLVAELTADEAAGDDLIGTNIDDVEAFASIIASAALKPPLSIGVFGEWGSGKTFFMNQIRRRAGELAGTDALFCQNVLQIEFNAWHYADANLLASLVSEIFDRLFEHMKKKDTPAEKLEKLKQSLAEADGLYREAEKALAAKVSEVTSAEKNVEAVRDERKVIIDDLKDVLAADPEAKRNFDEVKKGLGLAELPESLTEVSKAVDEARLLRRRIGALWRLDARQRLVAFLAATVPIALWIGMKIVRSWRPGWLDAVSVEATGVTSAIASLAVWLQSRLREASRMVGRAETALVKLESGREARLETLRDQEVLARQRLAELEAQRRALEEEMKDLTPGRRLYRFIESRIQDGDYRKHLGLVSRVREDFHQLSKALVDDRDFPVDRIVLYVDDLDRCPPERVVEVLQAVHLLLAFRLFVVVVGVDARWMSRSLRSHYRELLAVSEDAARKSGAGAPGGISSDGRSATAIEHDYLEKIFQIPFWLRPMDAEGCKRLVDGLIAQAAPLKGGVGYAPGDSVPRPPAVRQTPDAQPPTRPPESPGPQAEAKEPAPLPQEAVGKRRSEATLQRRRPARQLTFSPEESRFIGELSGLIARSPRRAKRFVNTYRLIKASVAPESFERFLAASGGTGDYQVVLALLAIVTGAPSLAAEALGAIRSASEGLSGLQRVAGGYGERISEEARCVAGALALCLHHEADAEGLQRLAPAVLRYSFLPFEETEALQHRERR